MTKRGELQSRINRKDEEIDLLKVGLSGIVRRYGFQNVQEFYQAYHKSYDAYTDYKEQADDWKKDYGKGKHRHDKKSVFERLKRPLKKTAGYQHQKTVKSKDRGAR